ncbi:MAG: hypothetical protein ACRC7F_05200, partial [Cetobacterium sp.]
MKKTLILLGIISILTNAEEQGVKLEDTVITSTTGFEEKLGKENKNIILITKENLEKKEYKNV